MRILVLGGRTAREGNLGMITAERMPHND